MTLEELYQIIKDRQQTAPKGSYVSTLLKAGKDRVIQKVGEEATEVVIAAKNENHKEIVSEVADLWFHTIVLLVQANISLNAIWAELEKRNSK